MYIKYYKFKYDLFMTLFFFGFMLKQVTSEKKEGNFNIGAILMIQISVAFLELNFGVKKRFLDFRGLHTYNKQSKKMLIWKNQTKYYHRLHYRDLILKGTLVRFQWAHGTGRSWVCVKIIGHVLTKLRLNAHKFDVLWLFSTQLYQLKS